MRVERDVAGIALFFAAGTAAGYWSGHIAGPASWTAGLVANGCLASVLALAAIASSGTPGSGACRILTACLMFFFAGGLCSISASMYGQTDAPGLTACGISRLTDAHSAAFREMIDNVPYPDRSCSALIKAFLSGDQSDIPDNIKDAFRDSGASHILALSGMHLGVLYGILLKATAVMGNFPAARKTRSVAIIAISAYYTAITGAAASLVRAFIFIVLNETAKIAGRDTRPANVFLAALTIQLAVSPGNIASAGFQLSYLAMAGIYILYPWMKSWFPEREDRKRGPMKRIWDAAALTISCQIFTAPAAWIHFGTFPEYFLITNLLAVPLSTFIMLTAIAVVLLHQCGLCPEWLIMVNWHSVRLLNSTLSTICTLP